jgi:hypothetical protein
MSIFGKTLRALENPLFMSWRGLVVGEEKLGCGEPDAPSNSAPIQTFMWWDARIDEADREQTSTYTACPVGGSAKAPSLLDARQALRHQVPRVFQSKNGRAKERR